MNIDEEKEHVYTLMKEITVERRKLTEMYFSLKERLDDLSKLEQRGLTEMSLQGYVDLHNKMQKDYSESAIKNIERESQYSIRRIERDNREREAEEKRKEEPKFKKEIQEEKNERRASVLKGKKNVSIERIASIVSSILRENGAPMSASDLHEELNNRIEQNITRKNFNSNIMYRINKMGNTRIERPTRGYYQYRL